jgi:hypothetical protein
MQVRHRQPVVGAHPLAHEVVAEIGRRIVLVPRLHPTRLQDQRQVRGQVISASPPKFGKELIGPGQILHQFQAVYERRVQALAGGQRSFDQWVSDALRMGLEGVAA